jgi:hypothetical protein
MKISLITLHNIRNYGSVLQTYATQKMFSRLGFEVEVVDYYRKNIQDDVLVQKWIKSSHFWSRNLFLRLLGKMNITYSFKKQKIVFEAFLRKYINRTKIKYFHYESLLINPPKADIYCTGSDQVWNSIYNDGIDKAYYLDYAPANAYCFAYSASIGMEELYENEKDQIKQLLNKYQFISVRENSALSILKDLGINAELVLDPTLMLCKEEWEKLFDPKESLEKYILIIQLNSLDSNFDRYVKNFASLKKMKVLRISTVFHQILKPGKLIFCPEVEEFLSLLYHTQYVITDSFHATAFSIIFNKQFTCIYPKNFSTRIENILRLIGLTSQNITDFKDFDILDHLINYDKVNSILERERNKSNRFLEQVFGNFKKFNSRLEQWM